jgi:putative ABC transport system permease protein
MLHLALRMFVHDRSKCALAIGGVAFAVLLILVQVGLFRGLLANSTVSIEHADADLWVTSKNTPNVDFPHYFPDSYVNRIRSIDGVAWASNLVVSYVSIQLPNGSEETTILYGVQNPERVHLPWALSDGSSAPLARRAATMVLDDSATRRFGSFSLGDHRELAGQRLEIVGKAHGALSFTTMPLTFTSIEVAQALQPEVLEGRAAYVLVKLAPGARAADVIAEIRRRLPFNDVHTRAAWAEKTRDYWVVNTGLGLSSTLTVLLGVLIGTTIVAQTLYASTLDHIKELGTLEAIGASLNHIRGIVVVQAAFAAVIGYFLALPVVFVTRALLRGLALDVVISGPFCLLVFGASVVVCVGASLLTFRRLSAIDPALVFRA